MSDVGDSCGHVEEQLAEEDLVGGDPAARFLLSLQSALSSERSNRNTGWLVGRLGDVFRTHYVCESVWIELQSISNFVICY